MTGLPERGSADRREASLRRFLGVSPGAEPRTVLAIESGEITVGRVEAATRRRWRQIAEHPAAGEPEAHFAKQAVLAAAEALLGRPPGGEPDRLGESERIDRAIVEILRASRGLNHEASLRLAGLARRSGLGTPAILARVRRLVDRRGAAGAPRAFDRLPQRRRIATRGSATSEFTRMLAEVETVVDADRGAGDRLGPLRAAGLVAIVLTLVAGAIVATWRGGGSAEAPQSAAPASPVAAGDALAASPSSEPASTPAPIDPALLPAMPFAVRSATPFAGAAADEIERMATGRWSPQETIASAVAAELPSRLEDLAGRIRGERGRLDDPMRESWASLQRQAGLAWETLSGSRRRDLLAASGSCFDAVETPSAALDLIDGLGPLAPDRVESGESIRRGAWNAALLAEIARRPSVSTTVRDRASERFEQLPLPARAGWVAPSAFEETAARWLAAAADALASAAIDERALDAWSAWFAATDGLDPVSLRERADLEALRRLVRWWREGDERTGRPLVAAAAIARLAPADLPDPAAVRETLEPFLRPGRAIADASAAAWVLSSLLARQAGFDRLPIAPIDASDAERAAWLDAASEAWPTAKPRRLRADPELLARIGDLLAAVRGRGRRGDLAAVEGLVAAGRLHEAAMLARHDRRRSRERLDAVEASLRRSEAAIDPPIAAGRAAEGDGRFASAMAQALNDREARIALVRGLRSAGGDLGPEDAKAFARAVLKDAREVRHAAAAVLLESFAHGSNVVVALLDLSAGLEQDDLLRRLVSRLSGEPLPEPGDPDLPRAVRAALAARALSAMPSEARRIDAIAASYAATLLERVAAAETIASLERGEIAPAEFAERLRQASSGAGATSDPVAAAARFREAERAAQRGAVDSEDAARLDRRLALRRSLAAGPSQRLVAELAGLAEWRTLAASSARPGDSRFAALLAAAERRRGAATTSLEQALELEFLLVEIALRLEAEEEGRS